MADKRIVHVEIDDRTLVDNDGLNRGLIGLAIKAEDSCDFEDILNNAMQSLYKMQPGGQKNYFGEKPKLGKVGLCRFNAREPGKANMEYNPSAYYEEKWRYIQSTIGTINLRERTYSVRWNSKYDEDFFQIPKVLMIDTEIVMECLGLTRKDNN